MKKILFSLLTIAAVSANAQIYMNDFEDANSTAGWTMYKDTNTVTPNYQQFLNNAWNLVKLSQDPVSGNTALSSTSWFTSAKKADRWGITPSIDLANYSNLSLNFDVRASDEAPWNDGLIVKLSTTGTDKASFTETLYDTTTDGSGESQDWSTRTIDLSAYAGKKIYLAFINQWEDGNISQVDNIIVDGNLATSDINAKQVTNVYPNPVEDSFKIDLGTTLNKANFTIELYDMVGKKVQSFDYADSYNISSLPKGVYVLKINDGATKVVKKIVKK